MIDEHVCTTCKHEPTWHDGYGLCWVNWSMSPSGFRTPTSRRPCVCVEYRKPSRVRRALRRMRNRVKEARA